MPSADHHEVPMSRQAAGAAAVAVILLGAALGPLACTRRHEPQAPSRPVRIAAAADLRFALDDIVAAFAAQHPDIRVTVNYGSSGSFYAQLFSHAPFDIFLSADIDYPRRLVEGGLAAEGAAFPYAVGQIVVWAPNRSALDLDKLGVQAVADPSVRRIAVANPAHAPYGRAAEAAMKSLGVYEQARDRLVLGENIAQAAQFVESGAADVGIIALSLAMAPPLRDQGRYWLVPLDAYPRLEQGGVILSWAQDRQAAEALRDFMTGDKGQAILQRYGFLLPQGKTGRNSPQMYTDERG